MHPKDIKEGKEYYLVGIDFITGSDKGNDPFNGAIVLVKKNMEYKNQNDKYWVELVEIPDDIREKAEKELYKIGCHFSVNSNNLEEIEKVKPMIIPEKIKDIILEEVSSGIKMNELCTNLIEDFIDNPEINNYTPVEVVNEMIKNGDIMEIEYCLPNMRYRLKSFLLPKGTEIIMDEF